MDTEKLLEESLSRLDDCKNYLIEMALNNKTPLNEVTNIPFESLPQYINEMDDLKKEMVLARLRREDLTSNADFVIQSLWNLEFDYENYKQIGNNDGVLSTLIMVFREFNDEVHSKEAAQWMYDT